ncbi:MULTISPECIES: hypothetical protein [Streptomycetaceae]|uniref:hypothetical protein n=1 Tax=Streptomycetaceae TaxID=2062 RepID=UPI00093DF0E7|nr:hypothetical protein [Streptomyces sp. CB02056]OKI07397.1 hypothetical protein AMK13_12265 [Streptomyces sp. CB02056]
MGNPNFVTGPVAPAKDPVPSLELASAKDSPYADPAPPSSNGGTVPALPFIHPGKVTTQLDTPYELSASAGMARQIATDLDSANGKAGPGAHSLTEYASTASTKIRGFAFSGTLTGATERWLKECKVLHDKLTNAADGLEQTRQNYHSNEITTAADLRATR